MVGCISGSMNLLSHASFVYIIIIFFLFLFTLIISRSTPFYPKKFQKLSMDLLESGPVKAEILISPTGYISIRYFLISGTGCLRYFLI